MATMVSPAEAAPPALALALAVDVSASVTAQSYVLQHDGIARAFLDRRVLEAIAAVPGGIETMVLEWSDPDRIAISVPWRRIADTNSARAFAAAVRATARSSHGLTAIGPALFAAAAQFDRLPAPAVRRVIDISGDGMANLGVAPAIARNRITARGIAINGLAIESEEPALALYYRENVIGGPGAFVLAIDSFAGFSEAMRRKLVHEVAGAGAAAQMQ